MADIIKFPGTYKPEGVPVSEEQRLENVRAYQAQFILDHSIELSYLLFDDMRARGMDLSKAEKIELDMLMLCETIKATMMRACGIDHPIHKITEEIVGKTNSEQFKMAYFSEDTELT